MQLTSKLGLFHHLLQFLQIFLPCICTFLPGPDAIPWFPVGRLGRYIFYVTVATFAQDIYVEASEHMCYVRNIFPEVAHQKKQMNMQ